MKKCAQCNGTNITQLYWVDANNENEVIEIKNNNLIGDSDKYCHDCLEFVNFIEE